MHNIDYDLEYNNAIDKMAKGGSLEASFKINTPTGATSKLTYIQQLLVRTKAFKEWFGDWEDFANQVVESRIKDLKDWAVSEEMLKKRYDQFDLSKGNLSRNQLVLFIYFEIFGIKNLSYTIDYDTLEPQAYWHGTQAEEFFEFKTNVRNTGRPYSYFALNKSYSENFSKGKTLYSVFTCIKNPYIDFKYKGDKGYAFISEIFIDYGINNNLEKAQIEQIAKDNKYKYVKDYVFNNFVVEDIQFWKLMARDNEGEFKSFLQSLGYDGVMYVEEIREDADITQADEFTRAVTIFEPNQVKLADGRNTEFSALNNDIRYKEGGEVNKNLTPIFKWRMMGIEQEDGSIKYVPSKEFYLWIYDDVEAEQKLQDGIYEYPYPTIDFNDDLESIWKNNKFKKYKGNKHIISFIYGRANKYLSKDGYRDMQIYVMTTKPNFRRQGINEFAIKYLREKFKLNKEQVKFEIPTEQGNLFVSSDKYEKGGLIAPNGKKSNLTPEQYKLVRTPEFKKWFGDWENDPKNASQVVDKNGEPLVVYRGYPKKRKFPNVFDYKFRMFGRSGVSSRETNTFAFYFTDKKEVAEGYGENFADDGEPFVIKEYFLNARNVFEAFTKKNEYELTFKELYDLANKTGEPIYLRQHNTLDSPLDLNSKGNPQEYYNIYWEYGNKYLLDNNKNATYSYFVDWSNKTSNQFFWKGYFKVFLNYDGIIFYETTHNGIYNPQNDDKNADSKNIPWLIPEFGDEFSKTYGVFSPNQIKLADGTNTQFNSESDDIRYAEGGKTKMDRYEHLLGIQRTTPKFAEGGSVATEHGLTNSGKRGGYFEGRSHSEGGIKAWNTTTNSPLEVEGGEVIITKKAVDDDELYEFEGEKLTNKQILSKINESGGGVKFEDGGEIHQCNCSGKMYKYGGETMEDYQIMNRMNSRYNKKHEMKNHKTSYGHNLMRKMKEGGYC